MADKFAGSLNALLKNYDAEKPEEFLPTGIETIDTILGGGISRYGVYCIWGEQGSGKSTIAIQIMKSFLKRGERCVFIDIERALNTNQQNSYGIRKYVEDGTLLHMTASTFSQVDQITSAIARDKEADIKLVVVDSTSMITPKLDDDFDVAGQQPGQKARQCGNWLTKLKGQFYEAGITAILINHARANISMGASNPYAPASQMEGGYAMYHIPDVILEISAGSKLGEKGALDGQVIHLQTSKNKFTRPFQKYDSKLWFGVGIKRSVELIDNCLASGLIRQSGAFYYIPDADTGEERTIRGYDNLFKMSDEELFNLDKAYKKSKSSVSKDDLEQTQDNEV